MRVNFLKQDRFQAAPVIAGAVHHHNVAQGEELPEILPVVDLRLVERQDARRHDEQRQRQPAQRVEQRTAELARAYSVIRDRAHQIFFERLTDEIERTPMKVL